MVHFRSMQWTPEQQAIFDHSGDLKVNAVAGSGKTSTLIELVKRRYPNVRVLYLAFNKSVKEEAHRRFRSAGLRRVAVETAHSLAYKHTVPGSHYRVSAGYRIHELVAALNLRSPADPIHAYVVAQHVRKFAAFYFNSVARSISELDCAAVPADRQAQGFIRGNRTAIERATDRWIQLMQNGDLPITHDYYLKEFQLAQPDLPFDVVLFDEGQDASPAMLDVFANQTAARIIVGDTHQQIYRWRFAVNALEQLPSPELALHTSFRLSAQSADLATRVLAWKRHLNEHGTPEIQGVGRHETLLSRATIARTNLVLLSSAIDLIIEEGVVKQPYFEGHFDAYTYASSGGSLYDVLALFLGRKRDIRDPLIRSMQHIEALKQFVNDTGDRELGLMLDIVKKYGRELPAILREIRRKHLPETERHQADMIFSTVHRSKGLEYDQVTLCDDFIREETVVRHQQANENELDAEALMEEINLLYVALSRSRNRLTLPDELGIESEVPPCEPLPDQHAIGSIENSGQKTAGIGWTREMDDQLELAFCRGASFQAMAEVFGITKGAIHGRVRKLGLRDKYR